MKALKVTVTGSYKAEKGDTIDYEFKDKIIPAVSEEKAKQHLQGRYVRMWIMNDKENYPDRLANVRETYLDAIEEVQAPKDRFTFNGKSIMALTYEEIQDLAVTKDLLEIPVFREGSLRDQREKAYRSYSQHVLLDPLDPDFSFTNAPTIKADDEVRASTFVSITNEEILDEESKPQREMSLDDLRRVAKGMKLTVTGSETQQQLMDLIQGKKPPKAK